MEDIKKKKVTLIKKLSKIEKEYYFNLLISLFFYFSILSKIISFLLSDSSIRFLIFTNSSFLSEILLFVSFNLIFNFLM